MKKLLDDSALASSDVVANNAMNRLRNLAGVNSYERELGFSPLSFMKQREGKEKELAWLDVCCGEGLALLQASKESEAISAICSNARENA